MARNGNLWSTKAFLIDMIVAMLILISYSLYAAENRDSARGNILEYAASPDGKTLSDAVDEIISKLSQVQLAKQGIVLPVKGDQVYIDVGSSKGARSGMLFEVVNEVTEIRQPDTGEFLGRDMDHIGVIKVVSVQEKLAICEVLSTVQGKQVTVKSDSGEFNEVIEKWDKQKKLAVLGFSGNVKLDSAVGSFFFEELGNRMRLIKEYEILMKPELSVSGSQVPEEIGNSIGADFVLVGNMNRDSGDVVNATFRLIDCASGDSIAQVDSAFSGRDIFTDNSYVSDGEVRSAIEVNLGPLDIGPVYAYMVRKIQKQAEEAKKNGELKTLIDADKRYGYESSKGYVIKIAEHENHINLKTSGYDSYISTDGRVLVTMPGDISSISDVDRLVSAIAYGPITDIGQVKPGMDYIKSAMSTGEYAFILYAGKANTYQCVTFKRKLDPYSGGWTYDGIVHVPDCEVKEGQLVISGFNQKTTEISIRGNRVVYRSSTRKRDITRYLHWGDHALYIKGFERGRHYGIFQIRALMSKPSSESIRIVLKRAKNMAYRKALDSVYSNNVVCRSVDNLELPGQQVDSEKVEEERQDVVEIATDIIQKLRVAKQGLVVLVRGGKVYIDIGGNAAVILGDMFDVLGGFNEIRHPVTTEVLGFDKKIMGSIRVVEVQPRYSVCEMVKVEDGEQIQARNPEGDPAKVIRQGNVSRPKLAILKFQSEVEASEIDPNELFNALYKEARETESYELLAKEALEQITPNEELKAASERLGTDWVLSGRIRKMGNVLVISASIADYRSGSVLSTQSLFIGNEED